MPSVAAANHWRKANHLLAAGIFFVGQGYIRSAYALSTGPSAINVMANFNELKPRSMLPGSPIQAPRSRVPRLRPEG
jgi:hypothetical protein